MTDPTNILSTAGPVTCPRCDKPFRLPDGFTVSNSLACPHCQEEVTGKEIGDALVPVARMVGDGDSPAEKAVSSPSRHAIDDQDFVIPKPLKTATRRRRSRHPERKSSSKKKKETTSKSSPLVEFLKIALGGLLALPIAQLVLWWAFKVDPLGLAPAAYDVAPAVVPRPLRPQSDKVVEDENSPVKRDMPESQTLHDDRIPFDYSSGK